MHKHTTKEQLLALLEESEDEFLSGEIVAERLSVSRTAIWKAVEALREEGYDIAAVRNKGYRLSPETDVLSVQGIRKHLASICDNIELDIIPVVDSTNERVREQATAGAPEGYTAIAITQTSGKGRRGRSFYSPSGTGLYLSILLRPRSCTAQKAAQLTTMAAVAACEAIENVSEETPQIKWVNDVYIAGKKVCGILTEASTSLEDGLVEYAILGIGFNVLPPKEGFPRELENVAGSIFSESQRDGRNHLAAEFLNRFMMHYAASYDTATCDVATRDAAYDTATCDAAKPSRTKTNDPSLLESYRNRSLVTGKPIEVINARETKTATALGIDDDYRLIVEYEDGSQEHLSSGEISIRISQITRP